MGWRSSVWRDHDSNSADSHFRNAGHVYFITAVHVASFNWTIDLTGNVFNPYWQDGKTGLTFLRDLLAADGSAILTFTGGTLGLVGFQVMHERNVYVGFLLVWPITWSLTLAPWYASTRCVRTYLNLATSTAW